MVMMLTVGIPTGFEPTQAGAGAELRIDQRNQMVPALEALIVGVAGVPIHNSLKLASIDHFKQLAENATGKAHAATYGQE